ncbi:hypothetical protein E2C01_010974 [Portunus trituberculatus]|uniref:Uncharacterized protein n=1 Tax=Portunus trituberculatus TaxID=210409 RepID=A0A5B7DA68_PORTR|nr:hypothetical protein [Portunus trituberculatus]
MSGARFVQERRWCIQKPVSLIGNNQKNAVRGMLHKVGNDALEDVNITLHQRETGLSLSLASAGRHNTQAGASRASIVSAGLNLHIPEEKQHITFMFAISSLTG